MHWLNFLLFVLLYAASCIPMYVAGRTEDRRLKMSMCVTDALLTVTAYIYLWYSFPSSLWSLVGLLAWFSVVVYVGKAMLKRGYDPYAELRS